MPHRHVLHHHTTQWFAAANVDLKIVRYAVDEGVTCVQVSARLGTGTNRVLHATMRGQVGSPLTRTERCIWLLWIFLLLLSMPLRHVSLQDLAELADKDLEDLGKMAGLNMVNRRRLIHAVQELSKVGLCVITSARVCMRDVSIH